MPVFSQDAGTSPHVAGIAAGTGVTFSGVAKGAEIMAVQMFSKCTKSTDCGSSTPCLQARTSGIIAGLERVYAVRGARSIASVNLSLGGRSFTASCNPTTAHFPSEFVGDYFFADLCNGWIRRFDPVSGNVTHFISGIPSPVDLQVHPDGSLYVLSRGDGAVRAIRHNRH